MEKQAKILLDPLLGDIQDHHFSIKRMVTKNQTVNFRTPKSKGRSFATIVALANDGEGNTALSNTAQHCTFKQQPIGSGPASSYSFCKGKHVLTDCTQFETHPH